MTLPNQKHKTMAHNRLFSSLPLLALLLLLTPSSSSAAASSNNSSSALDSIKSMVEEASDSFTDFIYSFSDAFLVGVGSSDRPQDFNITKMIVSLGLDKPNEPSAMSDLIAYLSENWQEVLLLKIGFVVCLVVGILFVILMPFIGFFFCCCRCCGNCGGGRRAGKRHSSAKKVCCHLFLFIMTVILILFIMGSFIVARQMNANIKGIVTAPRAENVVVKAVSTIPPAVEKVVDGVNGDVKGFLKKLVDDAVKLFVDTGNALIKGVDKGLGDAKISDDLETAKKLLESFLDAGKDVGVVLDKSAAMKNTTLQTVVGDLITTLDNCDPSIKADCDSLKDRVKALNADEALANVPTKMLQGVSDTIEDLRSKDFGKKLENVQDRLDDINNSIEAEIKKYEGMIANVTKEAEREIEKQIQDLWTQLRPQLTKIENQVGDIIEDGIADKQTAETYIDYGLYALYGISGVAGLAVLCLLTAFLAGCCSPKTSADCFMAFTGFYFIFCPLLMLLTLLFYNSIGQLQVEGCHPLLHPNPQQTPLMDPVVRHYAKTSFDVSDVLYQCSRGEPIFKIIKSTGALDEQLDQILDAADPDKLLPRVNETIGQVREMIEKTLNETVESFGIDGITKPIVEALDNADLDGVFANVSSTINVTDIKTQLSAANLTDVAKALREAETKARAAGQAATADKLRDSAAGFEKLETDRSLERDVIPILDVINAAVERLLGKKSLDGDTRSLIARLSASVTSMLANFSTLIATTITDFSNAVFNLVRNGVNKFVARLSEDIAPCTPVWKIVESVVSVPCSLLVDPFNGYWFEIGGYLGVGVIALIFAVKVAGILRDEMQAEEDEDQIFDIRNNHVTNHHNVSSSKNQVSHQSPKKKNGGGSGGGGGRGNARDQDNVEIEMRERDRHPPPYAPHDGPYRSTDNIYADYRNNKPYSYHDGHDNNGYRF